MRGSWGTVGVLGEAMNEPWFLHGVSMSGLGEGSLSHQLGGGWLSPPIFLLWAPPHSLHSRTRKPRPGWGRRSPLTGPCALPGLTTRWLLRGGPSPSTAVPTPLRGSPVPLGEPRGLLGAPPVRARTAWALQAACLGLGLPLLSRVSRRESFNSAVPQFPRRYHRDRENTPRRGGVRNEQEPRVKMPGGRPALRQC